MEVVSKFVLYETAVGFYVDCYGVKNFIKIDFLFPILNREILLWDGNGEKFVVFWVLDLNVCLNIPIFILLLNILLFWLFWLNVLLDPYFWNHWFLYLWRRILWLSLILKLLFSQQSILHGLFTNIKVLLFLLFFDIKHSQNINQFRNFHKIHH